MSKISLIIKREYMSRVKKKSFVIVSLLAPIGMILLMLLPALIQMLGATSVNNIAVIDRTKEKFSSALTSNNSTKFIFLPDTTSEDSVRAKVSDETYLAYMVLTGTPANKENVKMYAKSTMPVDIVSKVERDLREGVRKNYISSYDKHDSQLDSLFVKVNTADAHVSTLSIVKSDEGDDSSENDDMESNAIVAMIIAFASMMLIYMFVLISGSMVMTGVMEEKTSRIVEVLVSSVKPFDLMMGKIVGIALTVLTQFGIWIVFGLILMGVASSFIPTPESMTTQAQEIVEAASSNSAQDIVNEVMTALAGINYAEIISLFILYFLGGYLLYASLFACIGSAVESQQDGQQFVLLLTIPLIVALYAAMYAVKDPNSDISVWCSIIPFTSPIVMMARLPFSVPMWQIALSLVSLLLTFIASTWVAARIYRVGILMYGKKVTFKELAKWFRQSE